MERTKIENVLILITKATTTKTRFFIHTIHNGDNTNSGVFTFKQHTKQALQTTKLKDLLIISYIQYSMETFRPSRKIQHLKCLDC